MHLTISHVSISYKTVNKETHLKGFKMKTLMRSKRVFAKRLENLRL